MSYLQAAQTDDAGKTADAVVQVTVEDVNDSPPVLDQDSYSATLLENSPNNSIVFKATVTDADEVLSILNCSKNQKSGTVFLHSLLSQGGFVGTLKISPESTPFTIDDDGTVRVKNSAALDRETNATITFKVVQMSG